MPTHLAISDHRLDVDDRRAVDGFDRSDEQAVPVDRAHGNGVEAGRVRHVGGARREDAREWTTRVRPWPDLEDVPGGLVKPGDDEILSPTATP